MIQLKHKTQCTVNYWAGLVTAIIYNRTKRKSATFPSLLDCIMNYQHLNILFKSEYLLLKNNKQLCQHVLIYEKLLSRVGYIRQGTIEDFMFGYTAYRKQSRLEEIDKNYLKDVLGCI